MKTYSCHRSPSDQCQYGGNKAYNYGFMSGTASYCRHDRRWVADMKRCPLLGVCDECRSQEEGRHYCLLHSEPMENMDISNCKDFERAI